MHFWEYSAAEGACILDFGRETGAAGRILQKKMSGPRGAGAQSQAFNALLCARSHTRGLRDAEFSGICTPPPGVPAGKKQPPRRNMQSAGRFMQFSGCGRVGGSLQLESQDRLLGALEGADHVDLIEGAIGSEVDDDRKAEGKHHGKHVAQRLDFDVKVQ